MAAAAALLLLATASSAAPVHLEIYYGPMCSHCMFFLSQMLPALFKARLPGNMVEITLMPYTLNNDGTEPTSCTSRGEPCHFLSPPLCAIQAVPQPAPIDLPAMYSAYQFMICDLGHANAASPVPQTPATIQACAAATHVGTPAWQNCVAANSQPPQFFDKMRSAYARMSGMHGLMAPFIFINGELVSCEQPGMCSGILTTGGLRPFPQPAPLLRVICSKLPAPLPPGCSHPMRLYEETAEAAGGHAGLEALKPTAIFGLAVLLMVSFSVAGVASLRRYISKGSAVRRPPVEGMDFYAPCVTADAKEGCET